MGARNLLWLASTVVLIAVLVIADALERAKSTKPDALRDALRSGGGDRIDVDAAAPREARVDGEPLRRTPQAISLKGLTERFMIERGSVHRTGSGGSGRA